MATQTKNYFEAVGRRKEAIARVRLTPQAKQEITVNGKPVQTYFPTADWREQITKGLRDGAVEQKFGITIQVKGGGTHSQAEASAHGLARALLLFNPELRIALKKEGNLRRDPRAKERRKFGLKKARKAPQWSKR